VKRHAELLLQEFDSLNCQGVELESDSRERVQQLEKSAHMSMTREAIQIETNQQLRLLNRKKGKPSDSTGPGSRTELTNKGCRVLTIEEARLRKKLAEERLEADTQKQQRLEGKRHEKDFEQAMVESPMGGIYEAQPAAEPGESVIFKTMNSATGGLGPDGIFGASAVEFLNPEFFAVAPGARSEGYQHPIPRLKKDKVKRGYASWEDEEFGSGGLLWQRLRMIGHSFTFLFH